MEHLLHSFKEHLGSRGVHFYSEDSCNFLTWVEVFRFIDSLPNSNDKVDPFTEKLADTLANYDPDTEFLAVQQSGNGVSVELYSQAK